MNKREITDTIVIHCTQTPADMDVDVEKVTQWHKDRGFDTIGYHYLLNEMAHCKLEEMKMLQVHMQYKLMVHQ